MVSEVRSRDDPLDNDVSDGCWELHATSPSCVGHTWGECRGEMEMVSEGVGQLCSSHGPQEQGRGRSGGDVTDSHWRGGAGRVLHIYLGDGGRQQKDRSSPGEDHTVNHVRTPHLSDTSSIATAKKWARVTISTVQRSGSWRPTANMDPSHPTNYCGTDLCSASEITKPGRDSYENQP